MVVLYQILFPVSVSFFLVPLAHAFRKEMIDGWINVSIYG